MNKSKDEKVDEAIDWGLRRKINSSVLIPMKKKV